jgi:predicted nucleic acid-binding protein
MKKPLLLDTDVWIDFLRGHAEAVSYVNAQADRVILSAVVAAELYAGARDEEDLARLDEFLAQFPSAPVTTETARSAGLFKRECHRSHGVGLADAIIAATALVHGAELKTFNVKHYPMLRGVRPPYERE